MTIYDCYCCDVGTVESKYVISNSSNSELKMTTCSYFTAYNGRKPGSTKPKEIVLYFVNILGQHL